MGNHREEEEKLLPITSKKVNNLITWNQTDQRIFQDCNIPNFRTKHLSKILRHPQHCSDMPVHHGFRSKQLILRT
jgi:hypothetical protein